MLELNYTSTKTITHVSSIVPPAWMYYVRAWNAIMLANFNQVQKLFYDGTQVQVGTYNTISFLGSREGGRIWCAPNTGICYPIDEIVAQPLYDQVLNPNWTIPGSPNLRRSGNYIDDTAGVYLAWYSNQVQAYNLKTGSLIGTITIPGETFMDGMIYAGPNKVLAFRHDNGHVALLDYKSLSVVWQSSVAPFTLLAYDSHHNVVITLQSDKKVRVYLASAIPATLSNPALYPVYPQVHTLAGYKLRTRLTGSNGEPCPDYWVAWDLLGAPTKGYLDKPYSKTDSEGYAENFWFTGEVAGSETVWVEVTV